MEQVCDGLQYAHEHQLVHRDIKPANLFLENSGRVRVLDFGMVRRGGIGAHQGGLVAGHARITCRRSRFAASAARRPRTCFPRASSSFNSPPDGIRSRRGPQPGTGGERHRVRDSAEALRTGCPMRPKDWSSSSIGRWRRTRPSACRMPGELKQAISLCRIGHEAGIRSRAGHAAACRARWATTKPVSSSPPPARLRRRLSSKTRVMRRRRSAAHRWTMPRRKVMQRPAARPCYRRLRRPKLPPAAARPVPPPAQQLRYCPSCTFANPPHATECERCQTPFSAGALPAKSGSWPLYIAIAVAVLLAIALIVVLI